MLTAGKILCDLYEKLVLNNIMYNPGFRRFILPGNSDPKKVQVLHIVEKVSLIC